MSATKNAHITESIEVESKELSLEMIKPREISDSLLQKTLILSDYLYSYIEDIQNTAKAFEIDCKVNKRTLQVMGSNQTLLEFFQIFYEWNANPLASSTSGDIKMINDDEFTQEELAISTFHRIQRQKIMLRAEELGVICDFGYEIMIMSGPCGALREFKAYLHEVETSMKIGLYPKYWDFHDTTVFSKIKVSENCKEFKEVSSMLLRSLRNAKITKYANARGAYGKGIYFAKG